MAAHFHPCIHRAHYALCHGFSDSLTSIPTRVGQPPLIAQSFPHILPSLHIQGRQKQPAGVPSTQSSIPTCVGQTTLLAGLLSAQTFHPCVHRADDESATHAHFTLPFIPARTGQTESGSLEHVKIDLPSLHAQGRQLQKSAPDKLQPSIPAHTGQTRPRASGKRERSFHPCIHRA